MFSPVTKHPVRSLLVAALAGCLACGAAAPAQAADNADPGYQIKLQLQGALVVDPATGEPTDAAAQALEIEGVDEVQHVQYVDDADASLFDAGWTLRVRRDEGDDKLKLTYKARFDIDGTMTDKDSIEDALDDANDNNFDASDDNYEAQVNMSYSRATLDFSNTKKVDATSVTDGVLPDLAETRNILIDKLPGKMEGLGPSKTWAESVLDDAKIYGPLTLTAYTATIGDVDATVEITPMAGGTDGSGYYVEVSADADTFSDAIDARAELLSELTADGFLRPVDAFKTGTVLENY